MAKHIIPKIKGLLHGGDYNPEQWPKEVWREDMRLMGPANFDVATIGVFSWAQLEPAEGQFEFGWLDEIMDMLQSSGRFAALATPSAAMPAWLSKSYPEVLRTQADRVQMRHGRRVNYCWTSPIYRAKVQAMSQKLAERYGDHPALAFWHISNEYGGKCHCPLCEQAFRKWLFEKFEGDLDRLNQAYWTTYWSHSYRSWEEIEIPGGPYGEDSIMGLLVDWNRFCSDQIIDFLVQECGPMRELTPNVPITTNLMGFYPVINPHKMAKHFDFASWDSYPCFIDHPLTVKDWCRVSMTHDMNRSLKQQPFLLIESTPDSSNYYPVMRLKRPGAHLLEGVQAIAHGSEGVMYFQWRKCRGSSEQYHGAVIGHDGTDKTRVYRETVEMGELLREWSEVRGSQVEAPVAVIYDWENAWAIEAAFGPRETGKDYHRSVLDAYQGFWESGVSVDVIDSESDFSPYKIIVAPMLYMLKPGVADRIREFVAGGGKFVLTYWSAMVDENSLNFQGGFPGGLRDVFGIWVEETDNIYDSESVSVRALTGNSLGISSSCSARQMCDQLHLEGAESLAVYGSEFYAGKPAVTRNSFGRGEAYYIASRNDDCFQRDFSSALLRQEGLGDEETLMLPAGVIVRTRVSEERRYLFLLNFNEEEVTVRVSEGEEEVTLAPYGFRIISEPVRQNPADKQVPAGAASS